jgi:hypothetical protein
MSTKGSFSRIAVGFSVSDVPQLWLLTEDSKLIAQKDSAGEGFRSGSTDGCKREGVSTVNLNHPLAANSWEAGEQ